jgi:hypothetical protein
MATKRKYYDGLIPFNLFGDQLHYPEGYETWLESTNCRENGEIWIKTGHPSEDKKVIYSDSEVGLVKYPNGRKRDGWYDDGKIYVAKCNGFVEIQNYQFEDTLQYNGYSRGRSAAYLDFVSKVTRRKYTMFLTDFDTYAVNKMEKGIIQGWFTFCKRGSNFGLTMV